jgi:uncharacterized protein (TIGR03546 family)
MLPRIRKNSKRIVAILSQHRQPSQIAWGGAIGLVIGMIPKDNLIAIALIGILAFCRVNQLVGCISAIAITMLSDWVDPCSHWVGLALIQQPIISNLICGLFLVPLMPWTCLDNTLVAGGLTLGFASMLPSYFVCMWAITKVQHQRENHDLKQIVDDAIQYRKTVVDQTATRRDRPAPTLKLLVTDTAPENTCVVAAEPVFEEATRVESNPVQRAPDSSSKPNMERDPAQLVPRLYLEQETSLSSDTILRETVIEVVRYRRHSTDRVSEVEPDSSLETSQTLDSTSSTGIPMAVANVSTSQTTDGTGRKEFAASKSSSSDMPSISIEAGHSAIHPTCREESLKYLLSHINGNRDTNRKSSGKSA